jgi:release factor glutamine methyltransferase
MSATSESPTLTVKLSLELATGQLAELGIGTPRLDAELLLAEVLALDRAGLVLAARDPLPAADERRFAELLARRREREPVAYILGRKGFRFIELRCDPRALIPRPETELLCEVALELPAGTRVLDVGTGTGAVALALASERPGLAVSATDLSADALALAAENAAVLGLERVVLTHGDLRGGTECDVVLANLPYVPQGAELAPEITRYEPAAALYAGADGLDVIRRLCAQLEGVRMVALEHGHDQGEAVSALVRAAGFDDVVVMPDLAGLPRVSVGRR